MAVPILDQLTPATIERAVRDGIPRDWFAKIAFDREEEIAVTRYHGGGLRPVIFTSTSSAVAPAVVYALTLPKTTVVLNSLGEAAKMMRLSTAVGLDVDSWAWQFYGDLLSRLPGQATQDFRAHVQCLIHQVFEGEEFWFLPSPTERGIDAFFSCFGVTTYTPPLAGVTNYLAASVPWGSRSRHAHGQAIPAWECAVGWGSRNGTQTSPPNAWSSFAVAIFFPLITGVPTERQEDFMNMLLRRAKPFGAALSIFMTTSLPLTPAP